MNFRKIETEKNRPILFGLGNTFINCYAVGDHALLDRYGLTHGFCEYITIDQIEVFKALESIEGYYEMPGGSMINSLRTFNYLMNKKHARKHSALFFGAIGTDDKGKFVKRLFEEEGIEFKFDEHDDYPTDLCAVVIVDKERTPVIYCEANHQFRTQHIVENFELLSKCKMLYVEAFFITSNYEAVLTVANYANENNISFAFNIGGEYWIENYSDKFIEIFPHCDVLFGNFKEFKSLAKILGYETQNAEKCVKFVASYNTDNTSNKTPRSIKERLVLISMDKNGAILDKYTFETDTHEIVTVPSIKLEDHEVIDTSCAGDAFVGGFLAEYLSGSDFESSISEGHKMAAKTIQNIGCVFE